MNIIIPMAGRGSRLRPHTLTTPKPLIPVAGKPIVQRLVEDLASMVSEPIEHIGFVIGDFGAEVEQQLHNIAQQVGAKAHIFYQDETLGTAHAILCAKEVLTGKTIVAFSDTLFRASFTIDTESDGVIYVKKIDDPRQFGVVNIDAQSGAICEFEEKPAVPKSDLAIIGIYFFKDGDKVKAALQHLIDHDIRDRGEYSITDALVNLTNEGMKFMPGKVDDWMDCGNKNVTVETNGKILEYVKHTEELVAPSSQHINSIVIPPCFIGEHVKLENSVVGPNVSIGNNSEVINCVIKDTIVQSEAQLENLVCKNTMIGNKAIWTGKERDLSIGDYNAIIE